MTPIIAKDNSGNYPVPPGGLHQGICIDVEDLGLVTDQYGTSHKIQLWFELDSIDEESGKPYRVVCRLTNSLSEKATLRKYLAAWRGRDFTEDELKGFDLENLIGANCQIQLVPKDKGNGKVYANVIAIVPLGKGMPKMSMPKDYVRKCDREKADSKAAGTVRSSRNEDDDFPIPAEDDDFPF